MLQKPLAPNVFDYLDFRRYLKDFLHFLRQNNPAFRFQTLVEQFGLHIIKGRKLTSAFLDSYIRICALEGNAALYFRAIVGYEQASNDAEKTSCFNEILALSPHLETVKLEQEAYRYFSKWYHPVMLSMLDIYKGTNDHREIAKMFKPKISALQAKQAIQALSELQFVSWDENRKQWTVHHKFLRCTDKARVVALKEFHKKMIDAGRQAYENDFHNQDFSTLTLSTSVETKKEIESMIVEFREKIMEKVKTDVNPRLVVQMNLQLFEMSKPLSKKKDR
jgi:uncharacterized protein (TIGR02147 family)